MTFIRDVAWSVVAWCLVLTVTASLRDISRAIRESHQAITVIVTNTVTPVEIMTIEKQASPFHYLPMPMQDWDHPFWVVTNLPFGATLTNVFVAMPCVEVGK